MRRATEKRKLGALVAAKSKFKVPGSLVNKNARDKDTLADIATSLLKLEGEKIDVVLNHEAGKTEALSGKDLDVLLDRSPEVFADRARGWTSADAAATVQKVSLETTEDEAIGQPARAKAKEELYESS